MTTDNHQEGVCNKKLFAALFILWLFCFSCKAQSPVQPILEQAKGSPITTTCSPGNIAAGDLDNDGKPDLLVVCGQNHSLTIFKGKGDGQFNADGSPLLLPYSPNEIVIGDMNRDGHADLVIGSHDSYGILILQGDGQGNFVVTPDSAVIMRQGNDPHTHGLGIGDLNGDGYPDIVTANSSDNDISVMLNNGGSSYTSAPASPFPVSPSPYPLAIGDVDSDGDLDIASTSTHSSTRVLTMLLGDGKGGFQRRDVPLRTAKPWFVAIGDINKDLVPDLVMTHAERSELTILTGTGDGQFTEVTGSPFNLGASAWHVAISDLNHDTNPDVVAAANTGVRVMFGNGKGKFVEASGSPFLTGKGTWHLAISDVNSDGKPDVVTSNLESNNVSVLLGK